MKILVTGGAGYIGSHTSMALKKAGYEPVVLDNLVNGHKWAVKYGELEQGDIGDADFVKKVCEKHNPQAVIHFAAFIEVGESVENPDKYFKNNFEKAKILFDTIASSGVKYAVFSSTAAVYGTPINDDPIDENHPQKPINPYGESKLMAETYLRSLESEGLKSVALRYFNAAGAAEVKERIGEAHSPETHLIPNIIKAGLGLNDEVKLFGSDYPTRDGTALRDYIHVLDLASAHIAALDYLKNGGETDVFNLGTGDGSTVLEVVESTQRAIGKEIPKSFHDRRAGDPPILIANASKAKTKLGWQPKYSLDDIVLSAYKWHQTDDYKNAVK